MLGGEKVGKTSIGKKIYFIMPNTNNGSTSMPKKLVIYTQIKLTFILPLSFVYFFAVSQFMTSEYLHAYDTSIGKLL